MFAELQLRLLEAVRPSLAQESLSLPRRVGSRIPPHISLQGRLATEAKKMEGFGGGCLRVPMVLIAPTEAAAAVGALLWRTRAQRRPRQETVCVFEVQPSHPLDQGQAQDRLASCEALS